MGRIEGWEGEKDGKERRMGRREGWEGEKDGKERRMVPDQHDDAGRESRL
jgi:hypothetical protein